VAPDADGRSKLRVSPVVVTSFGSTMKTLEWPEPLAFWQSSQEHMNIE
jgi:hypothetical protein